ncbi:MAG: hypothetical protein IKE73_02440 [Bacilli bacterium]|nr:hypothetical protein [Bacilli bacterium]
MKKILILLICFIFLLTGCASKEITKEKNIYIKYIKELKKVNKSTNNIPFDIEIKLDKLTDELYMYQFIMDNVKEDIDDVEAIVIHNKKTEDIFPSIGIFDEKEKLLVDKKPSGIVLVGYIDSKNKDANFKALIKYKDSNNKKHKVYYVTK